MKKTANLSVYKLLGYLLLGIGAYAFLNANTGKIQAIAQVGKLDGLRYWDRTSDQLLLRSL